MCFVNSVFLIFGFEMSDHELRVCNRDGNYSRKIRTEMPVRMHEQLYSTQLLNCRLCVTK